VRVESVELHPIAVPFTKAFQSATASDTSASVLVVVRDDVGLVGVGEIAGLLDAGAAAELAGRLVSATFDAPVSAVAWVSERLDEEAWPPPVVAGIELALLDAAAKRFGIDVAALVGASYQGPVRAGWVVGPEIATVDLQRRCVSARLAGRRHAKLILGAEDDALRAQMIVDGFGRKVRAQGRVEWSADDALCKLVDVGASLIRSIEQPVAADDIEGLARVRAEGGVPVIAAASVSGVRDVDRLVQASAIDGVYVRVASHGGLFGALRVVERAWAAGLEIQLGTTFGSTGVLARASEILAAAVPVADCLDGLGRHRALLDSDVVVGPARHGLGVRVALPRLAELRTAPPTVLA